MHARYDWRWGLLARYAEIERIGVGDRMSQCVKHGGTCYLSGMVAQKAPSTSITEQTKSTLADIEALLVEAGTNKGNLLTAQIWLTDIGDFDEFNAVWDAWVVPGAAPVRACVGAHLAQFNSMVDVPQHR